MGTRDPDHRAESTCLFIKSPSRQGRKRIKWTTEEASRLAAAEGEVVCPADLPLKVSLGKSTPATLEELLWETE